jgi:hypothetical protein
MQKRDRVFAQELPADAKAAFVVRPANGGPPVASGTLSAGEELPLPDGSRLRLLGVGYYARLSVVDDPSIPLVYALLFVALAGMCVSILGRQSLAVVGVVESETGRRTVSVWFRDWRANKIRALQAEEAVREALTTPRGKNGDRE